MATAGERAKYKRTKQIPSIKDCVLIDCHVRRICSLRFHSRLILLRNDDDPMTCCAIPHLLIDVNFKRILNVPFALVSMVLMASSLTYNR